MSRVEVLRLVALCASLAACGPGGDAARRFSLEGPVGAKGLGEGGFSDLSVDPSDRSGRTFFAVTDRGPNLASGDRVVLLDSAYHQKIVRFRLDDSGARWLGLDSLRLPSGSWTTGRPPRAGAGIEGAWVRDAAGVEFPLAPDPSGFDFEGLTSDGRGGFWLADEYGPRLVHATAGPEGLRLDSSLEVGRGLPRVLAQRAENKGFEGLARLPSGHLVAMMQRPLRNAPGAEAEDVAKHSRVVRIVVVDPSGKEPPRELLYVVEDGSGVGKGRVGACIALDEQRLVVLEDRKGKKDRPGQVDLWLVDLREATDVADTGSFGRRIGEQTLEMLGRDPRALERAGIRPVSKRMLAQDVAKTFPEVGIKAEGLALVGDSLAVIVFDNDFGVDRGRSVSALLRVPVRLPPR